MAGDVARQRNKAKGFDPRFAVKPVDKKYECPYCERILRYPVQTGCGERFCRPCADTIVNEPMPQCPVCREMLSPKEVYRDAFAEREIMTLEMFCENSEAGCGWKGQLKDFDAHVDGCNYVHVACPNFNLGCRSLLSKQQVKAHVDDECAYRKTQCPQCGDSDIRHADLQHHYAEKCSAHPANCALCGKQIPRSQLELHHDTDCPKKLVSCQFFDQGCQDQFYREELEDHMQSKMAYHMAAMATQLHSLKDDNQQLTGENRELRQRIRLVEEEQKRSAEESSRHGGRSQRPEYVVDSRAAHADGRMGEHGALATGASGDFADGSLGRAGSWRSDLADESASLVTTGSSGNQNQHGVRSVSKSEEPASVAVVAEDVVILKERLTKNEEATKAVSNTMANVQQSVKSNTRSLAMQDIQQADTSLRLDIVDVKTTNAVLVWKIGDVRRRRQEAQSGRTPSLYSAPFYTSPCGYKMCARIYLDGDGMGKGKCVSIFFVMMRGEYDALLPWPFQLRVTMVLMDQGETGVLKRNITEVFRPDSKSASFRRPESEMNTGSGCPMFAPVSVLESPTYVRDDTIFVKIIVDRSSANFIPPDADRI